jgi:hypothetical protein
MSFTPGLELLRWDLVIANRPAIAAAWSLSWAM